MSTEAQHTADIDAEETNPAVYDLTDTDLAAVVRYHGANAVIDAVLFVAGEAYEEEAVSKVHELLLRRARATCPIPPEGTQS